MNCMHRVKVKVNSPLICKMEQFQQITDRWSLQVLDVVQRYNSDNHRSLQGPHSTEPAWGPPSHPSAALRTESASPAS